jgi:hypothetical protein
MAYFLEEQQAAKDEIAEISKDERHLVLVLFLINVCLLAVIVLISLIQTGGTNG